MSKPIRTNKRKLNGDDATVTKKSSKTLQTKKRKLDDGDDDSAKFICDMNSLIKGLYDKDNNKKTVEKDFISIKSKFPNAKSLNDFYEEKTSTWKFEWYSPPVPPYSTKSCIVFSYDDVDSEYKYKIHLFSYENKIYFSAQEEIRRLLECYNWDVQFIVSNKC